MKRQQRQTWLMETSETPGEKSWESCQRSSLPRVNRNPPGMMLAQADPSTRTGGCWVSFPQPKTPAATLWQHQVAAENETPRFSGTRNSHAPEAGPAARALGLDPGASDQPGDSSSSSRGSAAPGGLVRSARPFAREPGDEGGVLGAGRAVPAFLPGSGPCPQAGMGHTAPRPLPRGQRMRSQAGETGLGKGDGGTWKRNQPERPGGGRAGRGGSYGSSTPAQNKIIFAWGERGGDAGGNQKRRG